MTSLWVLNIVKIMRSRAFFHGTCSHKICNTSPLWATDSTDMQREDKGIPFGAFHHIVHWQRLHVRAVETCPQQSCLVFKRSMSWRDEQTDSDPAGREQEVSGGGPKHPHTAIRSDSFCINVGAVCGTRLCMRHTQTNMLRWKSHVCTLSVWCLSLPVQTHDESLRSETRAEKSVILHLNALQALTPYLLSRGTYV